MEAVNESDEMVGGGGPVAGNHAPGGVSVRGEVPGVCWSDLGDGFDLDAYLSDLEQRSRELEQQQLQGPQKSSRIYQSVELDQERCQEDFSELGYIQPDPLPCPCGEQLEEPSEECELCFGTGLVIPYGPTKVHGPLRTLVLEARYHEGLPLWHPDDEWNSGFIISGGLDVIIGRLLWLQKDDPHNAWEEPDEFDDWD